ncbi:hypothetical protein D9C73_001838 [Collichthys lucidus]|uniref:Uncharacterized protein n=1 Tax=Collichthys lucidus TaxID=240159 RepID=A0A4U5TZ95_COLLU|nr:hypothetical protein D9C73_001838 [Collichthys lucidus]
MHTSDDEASDDEASDVEASDVEASDVEASDVEASDVEAPRSGVQVFGSDPTLTPGREDVLMILWLAANY